MQRKGSSWLGRVVRSSPLAVILPGTACLAQIQVMGTAGASSTTAGRKLSVLPLSAPLAWLPKTI